MKLTVTQLFGLSLLLAHIYCTEAKRGGGLGGKISLFKKTPKTNTPDKKSKGETIKQPKQPEQFNQGGYPQRPVQPGGYTNQRGYPQQPARPGGYPNQESYPNQGVNPEFPAGGNPAQGSQYGGGHGGYGGNGGYPGGYMNYNPNNRVLSPHYGGSFGYGGQGVGGGSPFSHSVQSMGMRPSDRSRGFGRSAVMAAGGGAMVGMALGYGLGRFPRPPFSFHNPQEEHYYNHYMYRRYGAKSTDANDYSRDYRYSQPPQTYDNYMDSCMKRADLLPPGNPKPNGNNNLAAATTTKIATTSTSSVSHTTNSAVPGADISSNTTKSNGTAAGNSSTSTTSSPLLLRSKAIALPPAFQVLTKADTDNDDDTVSIVEIGYPALIEQVKARRCVELYMVYAEKYLKKTTEPMPTGGVQQLKTGLGGLLAVLTSSTLMLLNCNVKLLH